LLALLRVVYLFAFFQLLTANTNSSMHEYVPGVVYEKNSMLKNYCFVFTILI